MTQIRVALADDHPVVLAGVRALLQAAPEIELVGEAPTGAAALALMASAAPDVMVMDISMPELTGLEVARRAVHEHPAVKLLALTMHEDRAYLQQLLQAGVRGYLLKRSAAEELVRAIRAVFSGGVYIDPAVAHKLLNPATDSAAVPTGELSEREEAVLRLTARGFSNKEAAAQLELSVKTVETYRARAAEKLGLRTRAEIVRYGAARGWLDGA